MERRMILDGLSDVKTDVKRRLRLTDSRWARLGAFLEAYLESICVAGVTILAAALRLYGIGDKSIWYDESFVITLAEMPVPDMIRALLQLDPHPPLYYLLMHFWLRLGDNPFMARLPSALLSTASVPLLYALGARLIGRKAAFGASTLLAVSSFHVFWGQEARMYALLGLLCLASTFFLVKALQEGGRINWGLHALLSAAAMYTQLVAVFYLAAQGAAVLLLLVWHRTPRGIGVEWAKSQTWAGLLFLPWLYAFVTWGGPMLEIDYAPTTTPRGLEALLFQLIYGSLPYWRNGLGMDGETRDVLVILSLLTALLGTWFVRRRPAVILLVFLFLGSIGLLALVGLRLEIVIPKAVLPASFAFYLLLWGGLAARRKAVLVLGVTVLLLNLVGLVRYYTLGSQEDWRAAAQYLGRGFRWGDLALVDSSAGLMPLNYYLRQDGLSIEAYGVPFKLWTMLPPPLSDEDYQRVDELSMGRSSIWLVLFRNGFPDQDGQLLSYLSSRYVLAESRSVTKVRLFRFAPGTPGSDEESSAQAVAEPPAGTGVSASGQDGSSLWVDFEVEASERVTSLQGTFRLDDYVAGSR